MDQIDKHMIQLLQSNARMSASEISKLVNLSISAVTERLKKLESGNIITQYTAILNPEAFEKELTAFMLISIKSPQFGSEFLQFVAEEKEIMSCHYIAGEFDYMIKIITKNTQTLADVLNRIKGVSGVVQTNTLVTLGKEKDHLSFMV